MEYAHPEPFEVPIEVDLPDGTTVQLGKKVLIVDDAASANVMATIAGAMAAVGGFGGIMQPSCRWKLRKAHVPHQGKKEAERRLKQLAKRKAR